MPVTTTTTTGRRCVVCDAQLPGSAPPASRCRPCRRDLQLALRRQQSRAGAPRERASKSLRAEADPEGWERHLERLAARAAARLPLFPREEGGEPCR